MPSSRRSLSSSLIGVHLLAFALVEAQLGRGNLAEDIAPDLNLAGISHCELARADAAA